MKTPQLILYILLPAVGYLLGSIPFAFVIGKSKGIDIRTVGSKNVGATNLGRTLGKRYFWYAFLLDAAKGFFPVLAAALYLRFANHLVYYAIAFPVKLGEPQPPPVGYPLLPSWTPLLTAIACVVGHLFPVWLKFKGGKGVATGFGVVLGFWPLYTLAGLLAGATFVVVLMAYRYISLASMIAASAFALFVVLLGSWRNPYLDTYHEWNDRLPLIVVAALFALMIVLRHRANITRLKNGTERKIGQRDIDKGHIVR